MPALSAVVYKLDGRIEKSRRAPSLSLRAPAPAERARGRMEVRADVFGDSFYEVTFQANTGRGWRSIGTDDNAPYRVFHDVSGLRAGKDVRYRAIVLDNRGNKRTSASRTAAVPAPLVTIEAPAEGARVRGTVEVRAIADPERATHAVTFERSVAGGPWTAIGTDTSSPAYTVFDDLAAAEPRHGHADPLPGDPERAGRHDVDERRADGPAGSAADRDCRAALLPAGGRLRRLGSAHVG